jgi:hypothetical protein
MERIPKVSNEDIEQLAERIKPVCRYTKSSKGYHRSDEGDLYYIKPVDLYRTAFTWDPKADKPAKGLKEIGRIETFKPSIAEVLSQLPKDGLEKIVAFETGVGNIDIMSDGYHAATTVLYGRSR